MRINAAGIEIIRNAESLRLEAYLCPGGVWTIGWGHTRGVYPGMTCTEEQAELWLEQDIESSEKAIHELITVPLNKNQFSALVSWAFNVGWGRVHDSTLRRLLNQGKYDTVPEQLRRWVRAAGQVMRGLVSRREREIDLWKTPITKSDVVYDIYCGSGGSTIEEPPSEPFGFWTRLITFLRGFEQ